MVRNRPYSNLQHPLFRLGESIQRGSDKGAEAVAKGVKRAGDAADQTERNFERAAADRKVGVQALLQEGRASVLHPR